MPREIKCTVCRKHMGVVRDANLRKGIRFICEPCDNRRLQILAERYESKTKPVSELDQLKDIFGMYK